MVVTVGLGIDNISVCVFALPVKVRVLRRFAVSEEYDKGRIIVGRITQKFIQSFLYTVFPVSSGMKIIIAQISIYFIIKLIYIFRPVETLLNASVKGQHGYLDGIRMCFIVFQKPSTQIRHGIMCVNNSCFSVLCCFAHTRRGIDYEQDIGSIRLGNIFSMRIDL